MTRFQAYQAGFVLGTIVACLIVYTVGLEELLLEEDRDEFRERCCFTFALSSGAGEEGSDATHQEGEGIEASELQPEASAQ